MQRFVVCVATLMVGWSAAAGVAQTKVTTAEEYGKVMKTTAQALGGVTNTISAGLFAEARGPLATVRGGLVTLEGFWADKKRDDAVGIVKDALAHVDTLDKQLAAETPSRSDTLTVAKQIQGACASCHAVYREGDTQAGFRFKAGVL
jgi:hypothetical protein